MFEVLILDTVDPTEDKPLVTSGRARFLRHGIRDLVGTWSHNTSKIFGQVPIPGEAELKGTAAAVPVPGVYTSVPHDRLGLDPIFLQRAAFRLSSPGMQTIYFTPCPVSMDGVAGLVLPDPDDRAFDCDDGITDETKWTVPTGSRWAELYLWYFEP